MFFKPPKPKLPGITIPDDHYPSIIYDSREQDILPIFDVYNPRLGSLQTGDYSYVGGELDFTIERKSINDLIGSISSGRDRFMRELDRIRAYSFARLLIVGKRSDVEAGIYRSKMKVESVLNTLNAIEARYVAIEWVDDQDAGARRVEDWAFWHYRELIKRAGRVRS
jgi:ERCC4-type nuclease